MNICLIKRFQFVLFFLFLIVLDAPAVQAKKDNSDKIFKDLQRTINKGCAFIISKQKADGSWAEKARRQREPGTTAYHVYTLLSCKITGAELQKKARTSIEKAFLYLQKKENYVPKQSKLGYMIGFYLLALEARIRQYDTVSNALKPYYLHAQLPEKKAKSIERKTKSWMKSLLKQLLKWQITYNLKELQGYKSDRYDKMKKKTMIAWGYTAVKDKTVDLSVSMIAALGIAAAHRCEIKVPEKTYWGLIHLGLAMQQKTGGKKQDIYFIKSDDRDMTAANYRNEKIYGYGLVAKKGISYHTKIKAQPRGWGYLINESLINKGNKPSGSMSTAGITVLLVGQMGVKDSDIYKSQYADVVSKSILDGRAYLSKTYNPTTNPQANKWAVVWKYFYLYGLQRVGVMSRVENFNKNLWFLDGVRVLIKRQGKTGGWIRPKTAYDEMYDTSAALLFLNRASKGVGYIMRLGRRGVALLPA